MDQGTYQQTYAAQSDLKNEMAQTSGASLYMFSLCCKLTVSAYRRDCPSETDSPVHHPVVFFCPARSRAGRSETGEGVYRSGTDLADRAALSGHCLAIPRG